ncbi:MAG: hypothetical protein HC862_24385 [Scytonema sp. RU_4_4]|nr:hypothetical protein [Scytonema sp. RU_4_4]
MDNTPSTVNLGQFLVGKALYADCHLTKKAIADALQIKSPSVWRYDKIAYYFVPEYQGDYPELPREQWLIKKSKHDRTIPLTPYQTWVLSLIRAAFVILKRRDWSGITYNKTVMYSPRANTPCFKQK